MTKVIFEMRLDGWQGPSHAGVWWKDPLGRDNSATAQGKNRTGKLE